MGNFFCEKVLHGEQIFWGKFMGGCFTWGLMIKSWKGRGFKGQVKVVFFLFTLTWVIDILSENLTPQIRD